MTSLAWTLMRHYSSFWIRILIWGYLLYRTTYFWHYLAIASSRHPRKNPSNLHCQATRCSRCCFLPYCFDYDYFGCDYCCCDLCFSIHLLHCHYLSKHRLKASQLKIFYGNFLLRIPRCQSKLLFALGCRHSHYTTHRSIDGPDLVGLAQLASEGFLADDCSIVSQFISYFLIPRFASLIKQLFKLRNQEIFCIFHSIF